jgi:hypothetical protein
MELHKKLRIQLKIQSVRLKRKLDAVLFVCDLPVAHGKLRRVKTVRFRDAVFLRVESQPSKIEIFFLKKPDSIYFQPQTVIYATTNYLSLIHI